MKRQVLILGGGIMQTPVIKIAKEKGLSTLVFDGNSQVPGAILADRFLPVDISDEKACLKAAVEIHENYPLSGILTAGTDFSTTVAALTEYFGLPGHNYLAATRAKDKNLMRETFREHGIPSPLFVSIKAEKDLDKVDFSGPWVVKPVDSMGSRGVQLIYTRSDMEEAVKEALTFSKLKQVLVEEYIPGEEFSVDSLVAHGEVLIQGLADRDIWFPPRFVEMGHGFPSKLSVERQEILLDTFKKAVKALGLTHGAAKGDVKWHPEKGPMIGEIAARLSGGYMSGWTFPLASGQSVIALAIDLALGEKIHGKPSTGDQNVAERAFISAPGVIKSFQGLENLMEKGITSHIFWNKKPGDPVVFPRNNVEKVGNFILVAPNGEDLKKKIQEVYQSVQIRLVPGRPETTQWLESLGGPMAFPKGCNLDYYGMSREFALKKFQELTGIDGSAQGNKDRKFWNYLEKGGLQGLLYYWDTYALTL